jgi:hypothetical protein
MAGMPSAWCAAFPLSMAMAALLLVQQRGGAVASIKLPGSRLLMVLQGCLLATWGCGALPTAVLLAPLPAVAIYFAAAHSVTRKLRPLNAGVFLLIILILAGSVPVCFVDVEVPTPVPAPTITAPTAVRAATGRAAQMSRAYTTSHPQPQRPHHRRRRLLTTGHRWPVPQWLTCKQACHPSCCPDVECSYTCCIAGADGYRGRSFRVDARQRRGQQAHFAFHHRLR